MKSAYKKQETPSTKLLSVLAFLLFFFSYFYRSPFLCASLVCGERTRKEM